MSSSNTEPQRRVIRTAGRVTPHVAGKRQWSKNEDAVLIECLHTLVEDPYWKGDNGTFRSGYLTHLEQMLKTKLPTAEIKATPHIDSRLRLLKRQYNALSDMIKNGSGFGWNDEEKYLTAPKDVFDDWVKSHPAAKGLRNKPFPFFDDLVEIFGKEKNGDGVETAADFVEADDVEEDASADTINVEQEVVRDSESREYVGASTCQTPTFAAASTMKKAVTSKKRSRSDDGLSDLVEEISKFGAAYREAAQEIKGISTFFKKEAEGSDRRMTIFTDIMEIEGLSPDEMLSAGEYISKDSHKVDFFYSLPKEFRKNYVLKQLGECNPYRPSFDFDPSANV